MLERQDRLRQDGDPNPEANLIAYNVFVLTATLPEMLESLPHLIARYEDIEYKHPAHDAPVTLKTNSTNFAHREKDEMRDLTKATEIFSTSPLPDDLVASSPSAHWDPAIGQVYLGNVNDVPIADEWVPHSRGSYYTEDPFNGAYNAPAQDAGFDICIECHDFAQFPTPAHMRAADEHLSALDTTWAAQHSKLLDEGGDLPVRPPPNANSIVHLTFPSSPPANGATIGALASFIAFLDRWLKMPGNDVSSSGPDQPSPSASRKRGVTFSSSSLPQQTSFANSFFSPSAYTNSASRFRSTSASYSPHHDGSSSPYRYSAGSVRTRPVKVLIYSADGYTESSVLALCLLMALRGLSLPQAYLELQVAKKRSFFVYQSDLGLLKKVETRLNQDRGRSKMADSNSKPLPTSSTGPGTGISGVQYVNAVEGGTEVGWNPGLRPGWPQPVVGQGPGGHLSKGGGVGADPVSGMRGHSASVEELPVQMQQAQAQADNKPGTSQDANQSGKTTNALGYPNGFRRQRASTMPMTSTFTDHQSWFNDPRFNGSFPSRVLPFLYLGDLYVDRATVIDGLTNHPSQQPRLQRAHASRFRYHPRCLRWGMRIGTASRV
jgi:dual specificity MAP kinase phosphatase